MYSGNSIENQPVKIKNEEDEMSHSLQKDPSSEFSGNLQIAAKIEEDEASQRSESPELAIKTEELTIFTELTSEEVDLPIAPASSETTTDFKCYLCDESILFRNDIALQVHLFTSHPQQKKYNCDKCSEHRANIVAFNQHLQRHDPSFRPYKCQVCSLRFTDVDDQKQHEVEAHQQNNDGIKKQQRIIRVCEVCKRSVPTEVYDQHLRSEHPDAILVCPICEAEFFTKPKLKMHKQMVHGYSTESKRKLTKEEEIYKCYMCKSEVVLDSHELLYEHLVNVHGEQTKYQCEVCDYSNGQIMRLNRHLSRHDVSKKPFICNICLIGFTNAKYLKYHEVHAHNAGGSQEHYDCTICHKQLASCKELASHMRAHKAERIEEDSPVSSNILLQAKCYLCNIVLKDEASLKLHITTNHKFTSKDSVFKCVKCDYIHWEIYAFNKHLQKHDAFKCAYCTLRFTTIQYKKFHELTKHGHTTAHHQFATNMKVVLRCYLCSIPQDFVSKRFLNRHLRTHSIQSLYKCSECDYTTTFKTKFNNHRRKHYASTLPSIEDSSRSSKTSDKVVEGTLLWSPRSTGTRMEKVAKNIESKSWCYLCKKNIHQSGSTSLTKHWETNHPLPSENQCKKCSYSTKHLDIFNNHCARHDGSKRPFKCKSCPLRFLSARYRKYHEICVHENKPTNSAFCCMKCDTTFAFKYRLKLHMNGGWQGVSPTAESNSASTSDSVEQFQEAENIQRVSVATSSISTAKVYRCHLCSPNHTLDSRESLQQHLVALPTQNMYHCDRCGFSVNFVTMYNQHLAQHNIDGSTLIL